MNFSKEINKQAVNDLWNNYHKKTKTNPSLYTNQRDGNYGILISLPKELIEWAERTAGHHGFPEASPVGICRKVPNAKKALLEIFESPETLERFIRSSACDGLEYCGEINAERKLRGIKTSKPLMAKDEFWNRYTKEVLAQLVTQYGRTIVQTAYTNLTIDEFEAQFNLSKELTTA
jgi:hypothetical protein